MWQSTHGVLALESESAVPAGHGAQYREVPVGAYVPAAHAWHVVFAKPSWSYSPAAHGMHAVADSFVDVFDPPEYEPTSQTTHGVVGELSESAVPTSQSVQTVAPTGAYCPMAHGRQGVRGSESPSCMPAGQRRHGAADLAAENSPAWQVTQGVAGFWSPSVVPAAQSSQRVALPAEYWPTSHAAQPVDGSLSTSARPAAHGIQKVKAGIQVN